MNRFYLIVLTIISTYRIDAQQQPLPVPRNFAQAIKKGTRSIDGRPGKNYWQNYGRYNITVTAMPPDRTIKGTEQITYINNSPDVLNSLVFSLILNSHRPDAVRLGGYDPEYITPGIQIDHFTVNGQEVVWPEVNNHVTWQSVKLPKPLTSHDSVQLSVSWHYQISLSSNREGMLDSTTYYLAYFYPRVAVYDDYNGWDRMNFIEIQEFYNDFNDYTVNVQVPKNYIVWGTGVLQNPSTVLQPEYAKRLERSMTTDEIMHIATKEELAAKKVTAQNDMNTWQWKANDITDMTVALSDHYVWDASSVLVDDQAHRRASVQSAYNDTAADFHHMVEYGRHALDWFSHNWPGVPYPYPKTTIVQGYADMEYPMMVNDNTQSDPNFARFVAEHELAHTYFPFYMGINETRYGFMDEGWATTLELLIGRVDLGVKKAEDFYKAFRINQWIHDPSPDEDLPIITPGDVFIGAGLGNNEYGKPSLGYLAMKDMLGDELFKKCLHEYMERWHGHHPAPWDFFNTFNNVSGRDINWFWENWFFSTYYIDLAIKDVAPKPYGYEISIQNIGGMAAPVDVDVTYSDGSTQTFHQTPEIWKTNQKMAAINISTKKKIQSIQLNGGIFMDSDESNNKWTAK